jgi:hypothetical protein
MRHWVLASILGSAVVCGSAHAQTKDQFDLICTGTTTDVQQAEKPWSLRLSVDLKAGQFCFSGCKAISSIARIEPGEIVFKDDPPSEGFDIDKLTVSRADGSISSMMASRSFGFLDVAKGTCTVGPFTPFPKTMF